MTQKVFFIGIFIVIIIVAGYFFYSKQQNQNQFVNTQNSVSLSQKDQQELESIAFEAVDQKTKGQWDRKIEIRRVDESQNAVAGGWWAKDLWDWIAWRQTGGTWNVLVSLDGFDCKELDGIPSTYQAFFNNVTTAPSGEKYCYSHGSPANL